ncbi:lysylphosphatidylglycerol synthase domain-containing protein, partial [Clostridium perfringens]|uniref:lysylphosphatidylglycerol synthase domain-containing protein n=1 Tax=Clostridium perfringens TaxID=1502 RepID=UPI003754A884
LRSFLVVIGLIGFGLAIIGAFGNFDKLVSALKAMDWFLIPLLILAQIGSYYANARFYHAFFRISGHNVRVRKLFEISLAINFANNAIPAGGVAGT